MRIGFDLDGVVVSQDVGLLRVIDLLGEKHSDELMEFYIRGRGQNIDPLDYIADGDELYFITGRSEKARIITERWQKKYYPSAKLVMTNNFIPGADCPVDKWYIRQATAKAKVINENKIDVYFEDIPEVVAELRKLCKNTKIVKYGSR